MEHDSDVLIRFFQNLRNHEKSTRRARDRLSLTEECNHCTYQEGYILQNIYLCKTCNIEQGICTGCYMHCHKNHEVIELGPKKNFRCDCGLKAVNCLLYPEKSKNANSYNHNFRGRFCLCDIEDSDNRESDMYMCVGCFD